MRLPILSTLSRDVPHMPSHASTSHRIESLTGVQSCAEALGFRASGFGFFILYTYFVQLQLSSCFSTAGTHPEDPYVPNLGPSGAEIHSEDRISDLNPKPKTPNPKPLNPKPCDKVFGPSRPLGTVFRAIGWSPLEEDLPCFAIRTTGVAQLPEGKIYLEL